MSFFLFFKSFFFNIFLSYKRDGSSKEMLVFVNSDFKEIMCKNPNSKEKIIKQHWRLPISQIKNLISDYPDAKKFNVSVFAKAGGFFSKSIIFLKKF